MSMFLCVFAGNTWVGAAPQDIVRKGRYYVLQIYMLRIACNTLYYFIFFLFDTT